MHENLCGVDRLARLTSVLIVLGAMFLTSCAHRALSDPRSAEPTEPFRIVSSRAVIFERGRAYVTVNAKPRHLPYRDDLKALHADSAAEHWVGTNGQPWSSHSADDLAFIPNSSGRKFVVFFYTPMLCDGFECTNKTRSYTARVRGSAIFRWGCTGQLVPLFDLGPMPEEVDILEHHPFGKALEIIGTPGVIDFPPANPDYPNWLPEESRERKGISPYGLGVQWDNLNADVVLTGFYVGHASGGSLTLVRDRETGAKDVMIDACDACGC